MMLRAYTIYDRKALQYHAPFFAVADGAAVRSFQDVANDKNTNIGRHPADFCLYFIGLYDDSKGALLPEVPAHLVDALALVALKPAPLFTEAETGANQNGVLL